MLHIRTLGGLRFEDESGREHRLPTRKTAALAVFLAMQPDHRFTRDALAGLLWGDKTDASARHSLSQAVSELRRTFGSEVVAARAQHVWMPAGVTWVDAIELQDGLHESGHRREIAPSLYAGDFLAGLDLDQDAFEAWLTPERDRLRRAALEALFEALDREMRAQAYAAALDTAERMLGLEPYEGRIHRAIMRCHAALGHEARALRHFDRLAMDLDRELGVSPDGLTVALRQALLQQGGGADTPEILHEFAFVLEQLPYSVVVTDNADRIIGWNRISELAFGLAKTDVVGRRPSAIYPANEDGATLEAFSQAWAKGKISGARQEAHPRPGAWVVTPLFGPEGEKLGAFGHRSDPMDGGRASDAARSLRAREPAVSHASPR